MSDILQREVKAPVSAFRDINLLGGVRLSNVKCEQCEDASDRYNEVIMFEYQLLCLNCITKIIQVASVKNIKKAVEKLGMIELLYKTMPPGLKELLDAANADLKNAGIVNEKT